MKPANKETLKKSGSDPSTASQGKKASVVSGYDSDSSVGFIEDEYDSYEPPSTRSGKGTKSSRRSGLRAQDFLKNPSSKNKIKMVKIKQEPVSPKGSPTASTSASAKGATGGGKTFSRGSVSFHDPEGVYASLNNFSSPSSIPGSSGRSGSGDLKATKSQPTDVPGESAPSSAPAPDPESGPASATASASAVATASASVSASASAKIEDPRTPAPSTPVKASGTPSRPGSRTPAKSGTPSKDSPRRSPRILAKELKTSPGKKNMENHMSQYSGFARLKAARSAIAEESESNLETDEDAAIPAGMEKIVNISTGERPHYRAPYPEDYGAYRAGGSQYRRKLPGNLNVSPIPKRDPKVTVTFRPLENQENINPVETAQDVGSASGGDSGFGQNSLYESNSGLGSAGSSQFLNSTLMNQSFGNSSHSSDSNPFLSSVPVVPAGEGQAPAPPVPTPQAPPTVPQTAPAQAGGSGQVGGPTGFESPTSSNTTEVLSATVKAPCTQELEDYDDAAVEADYAQLSQEERDKSMETPESSPARREGAEEEMEVDIAEEQPIIAPPQPVGHVPATFSQPSDAPPAIFSPDLLAHGPACGEQRNVEMTRPPTPPPPHRMRGFDPTPILIPTVAPPPPPPQPKPQEPSVSTVTEQRTSTVVQDHATGEKEVINKLQLEQRLRFNSVQGRGNNTNPQGGGGVSSFLNQGVVAYPDRYHNSYQTPQAQNQSGLPAPNPELNKIGAWNDEVTREANAALATSSSQVPTVPADKDVEMEEDETAKAKEGEKDQDQAKSTAADATAPLAKTLITIAAGTKPPPERDPKDPLYQFLGHDQREVDLNAVKLWKQEERLRAFYIIFGTRDPQNDPTNATEELFERTGYRRDATANHIMAALQNSTFIRTTEGLMERASVEGEEQDQARLLLLECAIENLMTPKMQKRMGLRSAKGKKRTPEEAAAALKIRETQLALEAARRANNSGETSKRKPTQVVHPSPSRPASSRPSTSQPPQPPQSSTSRRPLTRQNAMDANGANGARDRRDQPNPSTSGGRSRGQAGGSGARDRSRSERGGRHHTPASDRLGRAADARQAIDHRRNQRGKNQNNYNSRSQSRSRHNSSANAQASSQGSNHGAGAGASASASAFVRGGGGAQDSNLAAAFRGRNRISESSSAPSSSQENQSQNNRANPSNPVVDPAPAAPAEGAGEPPQPPPAEEVVDTCRLIVSGHLDKPEETQIGKTEAESRLIPWIGDQVMATQRGTGAGQVGLRDIKWTANRIVIHPNSIDGGELIAEIIRTNMRSPHHPSGFTCEWNENMPLCAELTIRCPIMGKRTEREVRDLIEAEDGGLVNLNISLCGWSPLLRGGARFLRYFDEANNGQRLIKFTAIKGVVEAIMANPHPGKAYIGYLMGTVRHERNDVIPGTQITYRRQYAH